MQQGWSDRQRYDLGAESSVRRSLRTEDAMTPASMPCRMNDQNGPAAKLSGKASRKPVHGAQLCQYSDLFFKSVRGFILKKVRSAPASSLEGRDFDITLSPAASLDDLKPCFVHKKTVSPAAN